MLPERIELQLKAALSSEWNTVCFVIKDVFLYSLSFCKIQIVLSCFIAEIFFILKLC